MRNTMASFPRSSGRMLAAIIASAILAGLYVRGGTGWVLGFVFLVPWLLAVDTNRTLIGTLTDACAMSVAFVAAVFAWFGSAIDNYTQIGTAAGVALLLLAAPLLQPQFLAFALARRIAGRRYGAALGACAGAAAWVAAEWLIVGIFGHALGYTLGYGLYPSHLLRQAADIGGAPGLTVLLLLANQAIAAAIAHRAQGIRAIAKPLALAALVPLLLAGYGLSTLSTRPARTDESLRVGMVQSNIVDYERQRREKGTYAVVREVLDTHFAMTYDAVERQHADAILWTETAYPTTFGNPKSEAGAELDREILSIVNSAGVPFVFGTYDRDETGEYNAAAFVNPGTGLLGFYRKTNLFPLTEYVPDWLDSPALRRWLPWTGTWQPGKGARVFPLRLADGREIPALPMICLDDMNAGLAIEGARLGAQVILSMSNDSWFTAGPGMEMHLAASAFRSIETRIPQFRVTPNGYSAVIDATGAVIADAGIGERALVVGNVAVSTPPATLAVTWGNWVGYVAAGFLGLLAMTSALRTLSRSSGEMEPEPVVAMTFPVEVAVLPPAARLAAGMLRAFARGSLLWMGIAILLSDTLRGNTLAQIRTFAALFLAPEMASWCVLYAFGARASIEQGKLVLARGGRRLELALRDIGAIKPWRVPIPGAGASLQLATGERWGYGLAVDNPPALVTALASTDAGAQLNNPSRAMTYARTRAAVLRGRLAHPFAKFVVFPILLAIPAFRLHQHIAFGSSFGEYDMFGLKAYLLGFSLWWAAWTIAVVLTAAALRAVIETGTLLAVLMEPLQATEIRRWLERFGLAALYLGLPSWLLLRVYGG